MGVFFRALWDNYYKEDAIMRTITELYSLKGRVYLRFGSNAAFEHFRKTAEGEGFTLPIGNDDILALHADFSFVHPGWAGHMLFHNPNACYGDKLVRVEYQKWISGAEDYICRGDGQ